MKPIPIGSMNIRYARPGDLEFLIAGLEENRRLENRPAADVPASRADRLEFRRGIKKGWIRVLETNGQASGFLYFREHFDVLYVRQRFIWMDLIFVKRGLRARGLGRRLFQDFTGIAAAKGYRLILLDIFAANANSQRFHQELGFRPLYTLYRLPLRRERRVRSR